MIIQIIDIRHSIFSNVIYPLFMNDMGQGSGHILKAISDKKYICILLTNSEFSLFDFK